MEDREGVLVWIPRERDLRGEQNLALTQAEKTMWTRTDQTRFLSFPVIVLSYFSSAMGRNKGRARMRQSVATNRGAPPPKKDPTTVAEQVLPFLPLIMALVPPYGRSLCYDGLIPSLLLLTIG